MKSTLKWIGIVLGTLTGLLVLGVLALYMQGQLRLKKIYSAPAQNVSLPADAAALLEGKRIFQYRGCEACHGEQLQGLVYLDNPALGQVITPNLSGGGVGAQRSDEDLARAIRYGLRPDGTPLLFMPSVEFYYLDHADLGRVIAYIRSLPPVENVMPPSALSFTGFVAMNLTSAITFLPAELIPMAVPPPPAPQPGLSVAYGEYLSLSCMVCHGVALSGGEIPAFPPDWPATPNLTSGKGSRLPAWGEAGFVEIMQNGEKHGRRINPAYMPWKSYRHMTGLELRAVYLYLMSLTPVSR